jgi:hypothetical protein
MAGMAAEAAAEFYRRTIHQIHGVTILQFLSQSF